MPTVFEYHTNKQNRKYYAKIANIFESINRKWIKFATFCLLYSIEILFYSYNKKKNFNLIYRKKSKSSILLVPSKLIFKMTTIWSYVAIEKTKTIFQ